MKFLKGITVLDLSRLLPGGYASLLLAEKGARVIKVEQPGVGDYYRAIPSFAALLGNQVDVINAGKESLGLDLKAPEGREIFKRLVRSADVVLESFRPGVMTRLGLGFAVLKKIRSSLILCSITGFGQKGPRAQLAGHDLNFLGLSGLLQRVQDAQGRPVVPDFQVTDLAAGYEAALSITAALASGRRRKALHLDIAMERAARSLSRLYSEPTPLSGELPRYGVYETSDGGRVTLAALEPKFWSKFCALVDRDEFVSREGLESLFRSKTLAEWEKLGEREDICLFPVANIGGFRPPKPFPPLGAQTVSILKKLRYTSQEIRALKAKKVIA